VNLGRNFSVATSHESNLEATGGTTPTRKVSEQSLFQVLEQKVELNVVHVRKRVE